METPDEIKNFPPNHYDIDPANKYVGRTINTSSGAMRNKQRIAQGKKPIDGLDIFVSIIVALGLVLYIVSLIHNIIESNGKAF